MNLSEKIAAIKTGRLSAAQNLDECLNSAEQQSGLNAFIRLWPERARRKAEDIDRRAKIGQPLGALAGAVIAIKDNINVKDEFTTCGSKILSSYRSPYSATVIDRLEKQDAILIGKTNMDEFAMGSSNENSAFGVVKNPHDQTKVPGGSSGGSAVAVTAGLADAALGSDTGGSIRQPAALCGVVGLKPSYGRTSRYGLVAYASSLDQIGPITNSVEDAALLLQHISGCDAHDSTSAQIPVPDYLNYLKQDVKGLRIGLPVQYFADGLDPEIRAGIMKVKERLREAGAVIEEISLPLTEYGIAAYYILAMAEASSNLARYDGAHYGLRLGGESGLDEMYRETRSAGFGAEVRRRIILGTYVLSAGYYDAYYKKAQQARHLIKNELSAAFQKADVLITPTTPTTAFAIGEKIDDPLTMYLSDIYTVTANLAGICAISLPAGRHSNGLPYGIQILADVFREDNLIRTADFIEKNITAGQI